MMFDCIPKCAHCFKELCSTEELLAIYSHTVVTFGASINVPCRECEAVTKVTFNPTIDVKYCKTEEEAEV